MQRTRITIAVFERTRVTVRPRSPDAALTTASWITRFFVKLRERVARRRPLPRSP